MLNQLLENSEKTLIASLSTYQPITTKIFITLTPIIIYNIIFYGSSFVDGIIIGRENSQILAASSFVSSIKQCSVLSLTQTFVVLEPLIANQINSENKNTEANRIIYSSAYLSIIYTAFSIPLLLIIPYFLKLVGEPNTDLVSTYFNYYIIGVLPIYLITIVNQFLLSTGLAKAMIPLSLFRTVLEIGLMYFFVSYQNMSIQGWALATVLQPCTTILFISLIARFNKKAYAHISEYGLQKYPLFDSAFQQTTKDIFYLGFPSCLQMMFFVATGLVNVFFTGTLGTVALASYQIGSSVAYWAIIFLDPLSSLLGVLLPPTQNDSSLQKKILTLSSIFYILSSIFLTLIPAFLPDKIVDLYVLKTDKNYVEIQHTCKTLIPIMALTAPIYGLKAIFTGFLRSKKRTIEPMISELIGTFLTTVILSSISTFAIHRKNLNFIAINYMIGMLVATIFLGASAYSSKSLPCKLCFFKKNDDESLTYSAIKHDDDNSISPYEQYANNPVHSTGHSTS